VAFFLQVIPGIAAGGHYVFPDIPEKSKHHINDNRGAHGQHGGIHKVLPDPAGGDTQAVANGRTNTKGVPLNNVFESVHSSKIEKLNKCPKPELYRWPVFRTFAAHFQLAN